MNTKQLVQEIELTEQQQTNRAVKGFEIYKAGLVEPLDTTNTEFIVKSKYLVEYFEDNDIYTCECADRTFRQVRCCHIIASELYILDKVNGG